MFILIIIKRLVDFINNFYFKILLEYEIEKNNPKKQPTTIPFNPVTAPRWTLKNGFFLTKISKIIFYVCALCISISKYKFKRTILVIQLIPGMLQFFQISWTNDNYKFLNYFGHSKLRKKIMKTNCILWIIYKSCLNTLSSKNHAVIRYSNSKFGRPDQTSEEEFLYMCYVEVTPKISLLRNP